MSTYIPLLLKKVVYFISAYLPRTNKAVLGSYKNTFSDNAKYLYLHWQQNDFIRAIWISGDINVINQLNADGFEAYHRRSLWGIYHCLTAKYYFYNSYIGDINQYFARGGIKVNLWHGSPLKKIEFDITSGPLANTYQSTNTLARWENAIKFHQEYVKPDMMLSPSPIVDKCFSSAFRLSKDQLCRSGNPRTDFYRRYPDSRCSLSALFKRSYSHVILYAPTWNDQATLSASTATTNEQAIDWQALSKQLQSSDQLFLVRFHPNEAHLGHQIAQLDNIINISDWQDVYNILHDIDLLITDQSSLFIDLLNYDIPTLFYHRYPQTEGMVSGTSLRENYDYVDQLPIVGNEFKNNDIISFDILLATLNDGHCFLLNSAEVLQYQQLKNIYWDKTSEDAFDNIEGMMTSSA